MAEKGMTADNFRVSLASCLAVAERRLAAQVGELLSVEFSKTVAKELDTLFTASLQKNPVEAGTNGVPANRVSYSAGCAPLRKDSEVAIEAHRAVASTGTAAWASPKRRHSPAGPRPSQPRVPSLPLVTNPSTPLDPPAGTFVRRNGPVPSLQSVESKQESLGLRPFYSSEAPSLSREGSGHADPLRAISNAAISNAATAELQEVAPSEASSKVSEVGQSMPPSPGASTVETHPTREGRRSRFGGVRHQRRLSRVQSMKGTTTALLFANRLKRNMKGKFLPGRKSARVPSPRISIGTGGAGRLELLPLWSAAVPQRSVRHRLSVATPRHSVRDNPRPERRSIQINGRLHDHSFMQKFIMRPGSIRVVMWDCLTSLAIAHDTVMIPLQAFPLPEKNTLDTIASCTTVVWCLDILVSFLRGVHYPESGLVEMRPGRLAWMYLKSWFLLDIFIVTIDFLLLGMEGTTWVEILPLLRICRLLRLSRITKILKLSERLHMFKEYFQFLMGDTLSEKRSAVMRVISLLALLMVMSHFICCGWYGIAVIQARDPPEEFGRWVDFFDREDQGNDLAYQYATSYHWTVTQFTPASMEVFPRNSLERTYNIAVIFLGLCMFSSVVSSMTQSMMQLRSLSLVEKQQNQAIRAYISSNGVSFKLADNIMTFLKKSRGDKRHLREQDIPIFASLPENLLMKLHDEVFSPTLGLHPLFTYIRTADEHVFCMVCHRACSEQSLLHGEEVFQFGGAGTCVYFVTTGSFAYFAGVQAIPYGQVGKGRTVSEAVLWTSWEHCGRLSGEARCSDLVQLDGGAFQRMASQALCAAKLQKYAHLFVLESAKSSGIEEITDLWPQNRVVVRELTRQAAEDDEQWNKEYVKKLMMIWASDDLLANCFHSWLYITKMRRRQKLSGIGHTCCRWLCDKVYERFFPDRVSDRLSIGAVEEALAMRKKHTKSADHISEYSASEAATVQDSRNARHAAALESKGGMSIHSIHQHVVESSWQQHGTNSEVESALPGSISQYGAFETERDEAESVEV